MGKSKLKLLHFIKKVWGGVEYRMIGFILYLWRKPKYAEYHYTDSIKKPLYITPHFIEMGKNVSIWHYARIEGVRKYNNTVFNPRIVFHDGVSIQQGVHITCAQNIEIGNNTAIAANVTITDIHHSYKDIDIPIERQDIVVTPVCIREDCKIYNNAVILPGTFLGKHCTVGANSVVSGRFADYCVIVGAPAKVVRKYDFEQQRWRHTDANCNYDD